MEQQTKLVDAIEDGRIVKVTEEYARKERLLVLRKAELSTEQERRASSLGASSSGFLGLKSKKELFVIDKFRRPLKKNNVLATLKDNFHWEIGRKRKERGLGRRQAASAIGITEEELKMIENGVLPSDDYVIVNKVQNFYKINLRKDGQDFTTPARQLLDKRTENPEESRVSKAISRAREKPSDTGKAEENAENILGSDIEVIEDE